jgi:hypothetical protein
VEARTQDDTPFEKVRPYDIQKLIKLLKLRKDCGIDGIRNECLRSIRKINGTSDTFI